MNDDINYQNNPLHGLSLKNLLSEIVAHYGFEILYAYMNINCFKTNPSIESSLKFLKKTDWAREKVEAFYLYKYKNLPKASEEQFQLPPRDRIIPDDHKPGTPAELSVEDGERLQVMREKNGPSRDKSKQNSRSDRSPFSKERSPKKHDDYPKRDREKKPSRDGDNTSQNSSDPWANWRK